MINWCGRTSPKISHGWCDDDDDDDHDKDDDDDEKWFRTVFLPHFFHLICGRRVSIFFCSVWFGAYSGLL